MSRRTIFLLLFIPPLLIGCQSAAQSDVMKNTVRDIALQPRKGQEVQRLQQCQQQLQALRTLKAADYSETQRAFDALMRSAAQYSTLRTNIGETTQDTVDALYHYRVNLLCAQINQAVLDRLAEQGNLRQ